jgi:hypothetical protein
VTDQPQTKQADLPAGGELRQLVQRAERGDQAALPALRKVLDETPSLWRQYGDLALQAELAWLNVVCGSNLALRESLSRKIRELKAELGGESQLPLEGLLVDRVVACWLHVHYAELHLAQLRDRGPTPEMIKLATHFLDRAQQRYLTSIRQLATVRKLLRPPPSPVDVALRLGGGRRPAPASRGVAVAAGVGVED